MNTEPLPAPTWKRLGFATAPDYRTSGKDVGIVILDWLQPHATLHHLGARITYVMVDDYLQVTCRAIASESPTPSQDDSGIHGLMSVLLLSHAPFELEAQEYSGLAPAATFIVLNHGAFRAGEGERLRRGIAWLLERREEWNLRLLLCMGWNIVPHLGWLENTWQKPTVRELQPAVEAGILVVASNGNTRFENELPPVDYLAVGGFNDHPLAATPHISPYPDEPWGRNGDGHLRPDILAPLLYLPVPYCEAGSVPQHLSYFGQTSGAATLITGICAHILSQYPALSGDTLRHALVTCGDTLPAYDNPAPTVHVGKTLQALRAGSTLPEQLPRTSSIQVRTPQASVESADEIECALALTMLAKQGGMSREVLWTFVQDEVVCVRKVAVRALDKPVNPAEREVYWEQLQTEREGGVRGYWAYSLLQDAQPEERDLWIPWVVDANWTVRWCVKEYFGRLADAPALEMTFDPDLIGQKALPLLEWHRQSTSMERPPEI